MRLSLACLMLCISGAAFADDEPDARSLEAERQRLGNTRIQQDLVLREREEQRRLEAAQEPEVQAQEPEVQLQESEVQAQEPEVQAQEEARAGEEAAVAETEATVRESAEEPDMSETLEQLRTLGELKDAGYLTAEEYAKLKQKILADQI